MVLLLALDRIFISVLRSVGGLLFRVAQERRDKFIENADGRGCVGSGLLHYVLYERSGKTFMYRTEDLSHWATYWRCGDGWVFVLESTGWCGEGESLSNLMFDAYAVWCNETPVVSTG